MDEAAASHDVYRALGQAASSWIRLNNYDSMTLYVLRHAIAEESYPGVEDAGRQLTERGRVKARRVLSHARRVGVRPSGILTSPYDRAAQTAAIAKEELHFAGRLVETDALTPYVGVFDAWERLRPYTAAGSLMVVGHNPQLSSLVLWLLGARPGALWLKKSGLVCLEIDALDARPQATLAWLLTPASIGDSRTHRERTEAT